jgi:hypothetical protein
MKLTLRPLRTPPLDQLTPLQREQIGPLLDQADDDEELFELFDVLDENGAHIWDMHLFCGDDGRIHKRGTMDYVASFSQGGATGVDEPALLDALNAALDTYLTLPKPSQPRAKEKVKTKKTKKTKKTAVKKKRKR